MPTIDMHAHVIPGDFPPANGRDQWPVIEPGESGSRVMTMGSTRYVAQQVYFDRERRLEKMAADGIDAEAISPVPPALYFLHDADAGRDYCAAVNEFIAALCEAEPRRFFGIGMAPVQAPDVAAKLLADIKDHRLLGVEVPSNVNGVSIADERFGDFFQEAERLGLCVFVHAIAPAVGPHLPAHASGSFGFAAEIGLAGAGLIAGGILEKSPEIRVGLSHGAGGLPLMLTRAHYFWGRTWNEEPPLEGAGKGASPLGLARRMFYDALVFDRRALRYMIDMLGPRQLMLGSDFPAMPREVPPGKTLRSMDLPPEVVEDITWNNAFRFLGTEPPRL